MIKILWALIGLWLVCYGFKFETIGLKFFVNGLFHSYPMDEPIEIVVVVEEAKDE